ncbi:hypothetical protein CFC21_088530 [Triticum aestivum]|uniref:BRO1 domain-containing protein n=2 Tax=Triticum aestivum TaxID=4565 RepID=A0A3B6PMD5_WHEAT|nr:vacuolar-sorting protein BRO1-like [Triticum aestivum]KAF7085039.1 hypothetical protein CFC21_088530 [Triticum aestivum]
MSRPLPPMLSVPEKKTAAAELFRDRHFFNSPVFTDLRDARASLSAPNPQTQPPSSSRALLLRYHRLLSSARDDPCAFDENLAFTWHDAFRPNLKHTSASLRFEKAAVVFNVGAASSRIAAAVDRAAEGGVKEACGEFQRAAGAFRAVGQMMEGEEGTVDMSPEAAAMLEQLMLAQAQECCFERALAAGTSPAACSKVARRAALYYEEAYAALVIPPLQNHFERSWLSHVQLKAAQFNAEACYRYAIELHDKMEIGEEIARLQFGINAVVDAKRTARGAPASLYDSVSRLEQDMNQNLEKAVNENNRIYLMRVPAAKLLSPLPSASLVRSASKSEILDAKAETGLQSS